jgi:DNA-binding NtrC family response regulator
MRTILLIESDPAALVAQSLVLHCLGYTVLEVGSRGEAWRVCVEHGGTIHLLLTEAVLDKGSSIEFVSRLQLMYPRICALFLSDESSVELADRQCMPCEYAFLRKPFRANALANTIRKLLDGPKQRAVSAPS